MRMSFLRKRAGRMSVASLSGLAWKMPAVCRKESKSILRNEMQKGNEIWVLCNYTEHIYPRNDSKISSIVKPAMDCWSIINGIYSFPDRSSWNQPRHHKKICWQRLTGTGPKRYFCSVWCWHWWICVASGDRSLRGLRFRNAKIVKALHNIMSLYFLIISKQSWNIFSLWNRDIKGMRNNVSQPPNIKSRTIWKNKSFVKLVQLKKECGKMQGGGIYGWNL